MKVKVTIRNEWETPIRIPAFEPLSTKVEQEAEIWAWGSSRTYGPNRCPPDIWGPSLWPQHYLALASLLCFLPYSYASVHMMKIIYVGGTWREMNKTEREGTGENQSQRRVMRPSTFRKAGLLAVLWLCYCLLQMDFVSTLLLTLNSLLS